MTIVSVLVQITFHFPAANRRTVGLRLTGVMLTWTTTVTAITRAIGELSSATRSVPQVIHHRIPHVFGSDV